MRRSRQRGTGVHRTEVTNGDRGLEAEEEEIKLELLFNKTPFLV